MRHASVPALAAFAAAWWAVAAEAQTAALVAPVVPGAVPEVQTPPPEPSRSWMVYYLSREPLEEVTAFYDGAVGRRDGEMDRSRRDFNDPRHHWLVFDLREAFSITGEPLSENPATRPALVVAEAVHPASTNGAVESDNVVENFLDALRAAAQAGEAPGRFDDFITQNQDLMRSYYPIVAWDERGQPLRADRVLYDRCEREIRPAGFAGPDDRAPRELTEEESAALGARIQKLFMEGKGEEAQKLMMEAAGNPDLSMGDTGPGGALEMAEQWKACVEELRSSAYRTRIRIDTHPSTWDWRAARAL